MRASVFLSEYVYIVCFPKSLSLPSLFNIITNLAVCLILHIRCSETLPNCVQTEDNITKVQDVSLYSCVELLFSLFENCQL